MIYNDEQVDQLVAEIELGKRNFLDSETIGFSGYAILLQWQIDDGEIILWEVWKQTFAQTLRILKAMTSCELVGFNLGFDAFHLVKLYTTWELVCEEKTWMSHVLPEDHIHTVEKLEEKAMLGKCWKPAAACDLMLWSRKNEYQTLMKRSDIRIRKVPIQLAYVLAEELEQRVHVPDIYFANFKKRDHKWVVYDREEEGEEDLYFKDVVLKFNASGSLKFLARHVLGHTPSAQFEDIQLPREFFPKELGYAPTAAGARRHFGPDENFWPDLIKHHIEHWHSDAGAREYARYDIVYTRDLWEHFGRPDSGDDDSELACMVAAVRWRGFNVDLEAIEVLRQKAQAIVDTSPVNINKPSDIRAYLSEVMDPVEQILIAESTKKQIIEEIVRFADENPEAARRAKLILDVKLAAKEVQLYTKLLVAGRLHADLKVIGTMSSRMSGGGGLNVQGIKKQKFVRECFPMAEDEQTLSIGDFDSYEVTLADAVYNDPELREALLSGKKIHGLFGMALFPGHTYEEILASDGSENDMYSKAKSGVFALIYGGDAGTLSRNLAIPKEIAEEAYAKWQTMFPGIGSAMQRIRESFMALREDETGAMDWRTWNEPDDFVETKDGFRRYFTLENLVAKALFDLAINPPKKWKECKIKVARYDRLQAASNAVQSALYGAVLGILSGNVRAAANHEIQSLGATICKRVQRSVWDLQPAGTEPFRVRPLNVHDEIVCPVGDGLETLVADTIEQAVEAHREQVPLIGITWHLQADSWAGKKSGSGGETRFVGPIKAGSAA